MSRPASSSSDYHQESIKPLSLHEQVTKLRELRQKKSSLESQIKQQQSSFSPSLYRQSSVSRSPEHDSPFQSLQISCLHGDPGMNSDSKHRVKKSTFQANTCIEPSSMTMIHDDEPSGRRLELTQLQITPQSKSTRHASTDKQTAADQLEIPSDRITRQPTTGSLTRDPPAAAATSHRISKCDDSTQTEVEAASRPLLTSSVDPSSSSSSMSLQQEYEQLQGQYQTTLRLLYESNLEQSKLRSLLDYTNSASTRYQLQNELYTYISKLLPHSLLLSSSKNSTATAAADLVYCCMLLEKENLSKLQDCIRYQQEISIERKKACDAESAMEIMKEQYEEAMETIDRLKLSIKDTKRKQLLGVRSDNHNPTTPPRSPVSSSTHHCQHQQTHQHRPNSSSKKPSEMKPPEDDPIDEELVPEPVRAPSPDPDPQPVEEEKKQDKEVVRLSEVLLDIDLGNQKKDSVIITAESDPIVSTSHPFTLRGI
jgi:hypothetical protein